MGHEPGREPPPRADGGSLQEMSLPVADMAWEQIAGLGRHIGTADPDEVLVAVVETAASFGFSIVTVCKIDPGTSTYRYEISHGLSGELSTTEHPISVGMPGRVLAARRSVVVPDYDLMPDATPGLVSLGVKAAMAAPLWVEGSIAAVLAVGFLDRRPFSDREVAAVETLAAHGSRVLESATLLRRERLGRARLEALLLATPDALVVVDHAGVIVEASAPCASVFGYRPEELIGSSVGVLVPSHLRVRHSAHVRRFVEAHAERRCRAPLEVTGLRADGTEFPAEISLSAVEACGETYVVAATRDTTERRRAAEELAFRANHDRLTGLLNRTAFVEHLESALVRAGAGLPPVTVCFVDIDHFRLVNDSRGHATGDLLLVEVARRLSALTAAHTAQTAQTAQTAGTDRRPERTDRQTDRRPERQWNPPSTRSAPARIRLRSSSETSPTQPASCSRQAACRTPWPG